jgi:pimeloyl-ACP methyl ester carboxylesterase
VDDNTELAGTVYGQGSVGLILAPAYPGGAEGWARFAASAAQKGYRVLTFDFRGYGKSKGSRSNADLPRDLQAAVAFLKAHGASRFVILGAGLGGSAAIPVAEKDPSVIGLAMISTPRSIDGLEISDSLLSSLQTPSLWLAARNDMTQNVEELFAGAGSTKKDLWIYEGSSLHGTYILEGADSADLQRRLLEFVAAVSAG